MKKIYLFLTIIMILSMTACSKKATSESKSEETNAKTETNVTTNDNIEVEEAKKVLDSAFEDIKKLDYENLANKLSKEDKAIYEKVMPNLMKNLEGDNRTFVEKIAKKIVYEIEDQKVEKDSVEFKIKVDLFKNSLLGGFLPSSVPRELDLTILLTKEDGEYKISNIAKVADKIQEIIDSKKEK